MDKESLKSKISKLNPKIQEYIKLGLQLKIFNTRNIERVISRLEKVDFKTDNSIPGDGVIRPDFDQDKTIIRINQILVKASNKPKYYEDEVIFHELTHAVNGIYENTSKPKATSSMIEKLKSFMSKRELTDFNKYYDNPEFIHVGYGWDLLDEFVAQRISQMMVEKKYKMKYPEKGHVSKLSYPNIKFSTDLADYPFFDKFGKDFTKALYGKEDVKRFCIESLDQNIYEKIMQNFHKRRNGLKNLYTILGGLGKIDFAYSASNGHLREEELYSDFDYVARTPKKLNIIIENVNKVLNLESKRAKLYQIPDSLLSIMPKNNRNNMNLDDEDYCP